MINATSFDYEKQDAQFALPEHVERMFQERKNCIGIPLPPLSQKEKWLEWHGYPKSMFNY